MQEIKRQCCQYWYIELLAAHHNHTCHSFKPPGHGRKQFKTLMDVDALKHRLHSRNRKDVVIAEKQCADCCLKASHLIAPPRTESTCNSRQVSQKIGAWMDHCCWINGMNMLWKARTAQGQVTRSLPKHEGQYLYSLSERWHPRLHCVCQSCINAGIPAT